MSIIQFASAFLISLVVTALLSPLARRVAWKWGLVDEPNARRINKVPMPTGGGLAIFGGFLAASLVGDLPHLSVTVLAAVLILVIGILDDRYQLSAGAKFAGQLAAVLIYVLWGPRIEFISNPFGGMIYLGKLSIPLTMLWVLTLINIMNFIDGLDGLTTGIALIAAAALASLALLLGRYDAALMAIIVVGAALGFLPYNFNPAKLYLGMEGYAAGLSPRRHFHRRSSEGRCHHQYFGTHLDSRGASYRSALCGGAPHAEWCPLLSGRSFPLPSSSSGSGFQPEAGGWISLSNHPILSHHGGPHRPSIANHLVGGAGFRPGFLVWFYTGRYDSTFRIT